VVGSGEQASTVSKHGRRELVKEEKRKKIIRSHVLESFIHIYLSVDRPQNQR